MPRGQIELWMLTKFGMLFFIMALFAIIFVYQTAQQKQTCQSEAAGISGGIAGRIAEVIQSPAEDEARAYPLPPSFSLGRENKARYYVNVTLLEKTGPAAQAGKEGSIIVEVAPSTAECKVGPGVPFSGLEGVLLRGGKVRQEGQVARGTLTRTVMELNPNRIVQSTGVAVRSEYLMIIRCGSKTLPKKSYLFLQDCTQPEVSSCLDFSDKEIACACGWDFEQQAAGGCS